RICDDSSGGAVAVARENNLIRVREIGVIENIEDLGPELQIQSLTDSHLRLCPTEENALTVGAVYDRPFFLDSTKYGRSQTAPTVANFGSGDLLGKAHHRKEGNNA